MSIDKNIGINIVVSKKSQDILNKFESTGYFGKSQIEIAKIAISYAIGNEYDKDIDLNTYTIEGTTTNKWAMSSLREDYFEDLIKVLRPDVKNINIALRNLIDIGLQKMDEDLWDKSSNKYDITKLFELKNI